MKMLDYATKFPEVNPLLLRKWHHAFTTFFDINGNGYLEMEDFQTLANIIGAMRGLRSHEYISAKLAFGEIWYALSTAAGQDLDGKITMHDWIKMWSTAKEPKWEKVYLDYMFTLFDASGDRLIDHSEYVQVMSYFNIPRDESSDSFDKFAVSSSGALMMAIDWRQYTELWKEYFHSTKKNALGNHLFGCFM